MNKNYNLDDDVYLICKALASLTLTTNGYDYDYELGMAKKFIDRYEQLQFDVIYNNLESEDVYENNN